MVPNEEPPIEVRNYTPFWHLERKIYSFYDVQLPMPISLVVIGVFVGSGVPWWLLLWILHVPITTPWYLIWLVPPGVLAWLGNKPIFEGKNLIQYLRSRVIHLMENRKYKRLEPDLTKYDTPVILEQNISTNAYSITPTPFK